MKLKKGEYIIEAEAGSLDLYDIANNPSELEYLTGIKNQLAKEGLHNDVSKGKLCINTLAALVIYMGELEMLMETTNESELH